MEFVFEAKEKKMKVKVAGQEHMMRVPKMHEAETLQDAVQKADPKDVKNIYEDFFVSLGLPESVMKQFDVIDFQDFIGFVLFPKKS
jgi:hypothetical protein